MLKEATSKNGKKGQKNLSKSVGNEAQENTNETQTDDGGDMNEGEELYDNTKEDEGSDEEEEKEIEDGDDDDDIGKNSDERGLSRNLRKEITLTERMMYCRQMEESDSDAEPSSTSSFCDEGDYDPPDMREYSEQCKSPRIKKLYKMQRDEIECLLQDSNEAKEKSLKLKKTLGINENCRNGTRILRIVDNTRLYMCLSTWLSIRSTTQRERTESSYAQYFFPSLDNQLNSNLLDTAAVPNRYVDRGSNEAMT